MKNMEGQLVPDVPAMIASSVRFLFVGIVALGLGCSSPAANESDPSVCKDVGYCNASVDVCTCDTTCERLGPDVYSCELSCEKDADCTSQMHPVTGAAFTECVTAQDQTHDTFGKYCR